MTCPCNTLRLGGWDRGSTHWVFEMREDDEGEFYRQVTLWKATREERKLYEDNA
jgi:hypothetical protein